MSQKEQIEQALIKLDRSTCIDQFDIMNEFYRLDLSLVEPEDKEYFDLLTIPFCKYRPGERKEKNELFISDVNISDSQNALNIWNMLADRVSNPYIKMHYAGISWEYSVKEKMCRDPSYAILAIDNLLKIVNDSLYKHEFQCIGLLEWALNLCYQLKDAERKNVVRDCIVNFENKVCDDQKCGLWGFSYLILIEDGSRKDIVNIDLENKIIEDVEQRFNRLTNSSLPEVLAKNHYPAMRAAELLVDYKRKKQDLESRKVIYKRLLTLIINAKFESNLVLAHHLLKLFTQVKAEGFNDLADEITPHLTKANNDGFNEFKVVEHSIQIKKEEVEQWTHEFLGESFDVSISMLANKYFKPIDYHKNSLEQNSNKFIANRLLPRQIVDHKGRQIVVIGTYPEDIDGNLYVSISQYINNGVSALFLRSAIDAIFAKFNSTENDVVNLLLDSPLFDCEYKEILHIGLKRYLEKDYISSINILIPQVESSIRRLYEFCGGNVYKRTRNGGLQLKLLDEILSEPEITNVLGDLAVYIKIIYTDQRGLNIRNNVCHGFYPPGIFNHAVADLIFYTLICLGQLVEQKA